MKLAILAIILGILLLYNVSAEIPTFKEDNYVNYRFRCIDEDNNYCNNATILYLSIESPTGNNSVDNSTMTWNYTYYNHSLPTNDLGEYNCIIVSPSVNGTISEFKYLVTTTGNPRINSGEGFSLFASLLLLIVIAGFFFAIGIKAENNAFKIILIGTSAIVFIIGILYALLSVTQFLGSFSDIVEGYTTFWFVMKIFIGIGIVALLVAVLLLSYNLWMIKRGFRD